MLLDVLIKDIQTNFPKPKMHGEDGRLEKAFRALESVHDLPIAFILLGIRILSSLSYENAPERLQLTQILKENNLNSANLRVLSTIYQKNKVLIPIYDANQSVSGFSSQKTNLQRSRGYALYDFWYPADPMCFLFLTALALSWLTNPMTKSLKTYLPDLKILN